MRQLKEVQDGEIFYSSQGREMRKTKYRALGYHDEGFAIISASSIGCSPSSFPNIVCTDNAGEIYVLPPEFNCN